jgi:murein L,D-transpeptidase YafK
MMSRRVALWLGISVASALLAILAWDFLKLDRKPPELADTQARATTIVIEKSPRRITLERDGAVLKSYDVSLGSSPIGHKRQEGDRKTPEGTYFIDFKHPRSRFHLSLRTSYPNAADREQASRRGVSAGSDIMIHGLPNGLGWLGALHLYRDWTDGCIAVTNAQIEEIWTMVDVGTRVEIRP